MHVRICGGPGWGTTQVYPARNSALDRLPFSRLQDREAIGMAKAYLEMRQSDLNAVNAALAVLAAAK